MGKSRKKPTQGGRSKQDEPDLFLSHDNDRNDEDDGDEVDAFYRERDDNLRTALSKTTKKPSKNKKSVSWALGNDGSDEENGRDEVLAFDDDESMESDDEYQQIEGGDEDEDEEGEDMDEDLTGSWGTSRKTFYNEDANVDDEDAKLEEQEALQIQKKYYGMLEKKDFGLDLFKPKLSTTLPTDRQLDEQSLRRHIILPDNLLELSANDRLQLIRDQSPELEPLCREFKNIFDDLKIYLLPFVHLVIDTSSLEEFHAYSGWQFVVSLLELYLTYCSYLSLYLMMKSTDLNQAKHPIIDDIEQYRKLCQLVDDDFQSMKPELLTLCELLQERKTKLNQSSNSKEKQSITKPRLILSNGIQPPTKTTNGIGAKPSLRERMVKRREQQVPSEDNVKFEEETDDKPEKRSITYQIKKNKGLTTKRKKEYRNPRVRHRNKYARALVKRKSRVPTARSEEAKYTGEATGIRAGIKRGIKLKS